ncbi:hypothetical protein [Anaerosporobacter sp.]|uniref:hypothetical protein n=1 Tax=Anaerosporobacter sp. TaxID=1872529 RepID=UPI00286EBF63|nr:hypothetical protein [Anaerosporobacter sp.]
MELVGIDNGFIELSNYEMLAYDGGGAWEVVQAVVGTVCIAIAPAVGVAAGVVLPPGSKIVGGIAATAQMINIGAGLLDNATKK